MSNINYAVVNGKLYKLQHPGNREWIRLQQSLLKIQDGSNSIDFEKLLDYCFEHVVFPEKGAKLNIDTIPLKELEAWQIICPSFLRGELDSGYVYPTDKASVKAGQKLLQEVEKKS